MNPRFDKSPRFNAIGLAAGSIVALLVAMAISFTYNIEPVDESPSVNVAQADSMSL